jgi:hypothetical protein
VSLFNCRVLRWQSDPEQKEQDPEHVVIHSRDVYTLYKDCMSSGRINLVRIPNVPVPGDYTQVAEIRGMNRVFVRREQAGRWSPVVEPIRNNFIG